MKPLTYLFIFLLIAAFFYAGVEYGTAHPAPVSITITDYSGNTVVSEHVELLTSQGTIGLSTRSRYVNESDITSYDIGVARK